MSERRCPKCGTVYPATARFCPRDGSLLVERQAKPLASAAAASETAVRTPARAARGRDRAGALSGQLLDARYQVLKKLGEGGMSYVYLAKEVATAQAVAIKVLSPKLAAEKNSVERLRREAGLAMRLAHPNVCRSLRLGECQGRLISLVMSILPGAVLSDLEAHGATMHIGPQDHPQI